MITMRSIRTLSASTTTTRLRGPEPLGGTAEPGAVRGSPEGVSALRRRAAERWPTADRISVARAIYRRKFTLKRWFTDRSGPSYFTRTSIEVTHLIRNRRAV